MANSYKRELLRVAVAQICLTVGYNSTQNTPLELLQDVLHKFLIEFSRDLRRHVENYNRLEANLNDSLLTLMNLKINTHELMDYITNVEPVPYIVDVPKFPTKKYSNFNFLKPGSKEVLTRPIHVFEYLPPMLPLDTENVTFYSNTDNNIKISVGIEQRNSDESKNSIFNSTEIKSHKLSTGNTNSENAPADKYPVIPNSMQDEGYPTREISSVVMTTGGFISPAMEGKVPDSIVPELIEKYQGFDIPPPLEHPVPQTEQCSDTSNHNKVIKKTDTVTKENDLNKKKNYLLECNTVDNNVGSSTQKNNLNASQVFESASSKKEMLSGYDSIVNEKSKRKKIKLLQKIKKNKVGDVIKKNIEKNVSIQHEVATDANQFTNHMKKTENPQLKNGELNDPIYSPLGTNSVATSVVNSMVTGKNVFKDCDNTDALLKTVEERILLTDSAESKISQLITESNQPCTSTRTLNTIFTNYNKNVENNIGPSNVVSKTNFPTGKEPENQTQDVKLTVLPDRNKLDIFKKISKQKCGKDIITSSTNPYLFSSSDNAVNDRSLINLPLGTTITPAPSVQEVISFQDDSLKNMHGLNAFTPFPNCDVKKVGGISSKVPILDNKPKKRGRKPGSKNQPKVQNQGSTFNMQISPSKTANLKIENQAFKNVLSSTAMPCPVNTMNISNSSHSMEMKTPSPLTKESSKIEKDSPLKEKKQKKKKKIKNEMNLNFTNEFLFPKEENSALANFMQLDESKNIASGFSSKAPNDTKIFCEHPGGLLKKSGIKPFNTIGRPQILEEIPPTALPNANMFPMLPLLAFPTRPGLIPSTSLFSGSTMQLSSHGHPGAPTNMLINSLLPFGNLKTSMSGTDIFTPEKGRNESKTSTMFSDHNFCNVPPLIPEFMSLQSKPGVIDPTGITNVKTLPSPKLKECTTKFYSKAIDFNSSEEILKIESSQSKMSGNSADEIGNTANFSTELSKNIFQKQMSSTINDGNYFDFSTNAFRPPSVKIHQKLFPENISMPSNELIELSDDSNDAPTSKEHIKKISLPINKEESLKHVHPVSKNIKKQKIAKKLKKNILLNSSPLDLLVNDQSTENVKNNCYGKLAGGAELIPLVGTSTGLAYSSKTIPTTSLTGSAVINKDVSQIDGNFPVGNIDDVTITPKVLDNSTIKKKKEHRKLKKVKDGKIKKKKDKKDKMKNKDKIDKYLSNNEKTEMKKNKKNKKKVKQQIEVPINSQSSVTNCLPAVAEGIIPYDVNSLNQQKNVDSFAQLNQPSRIPSLPHVPKLTLKFSESKSPKHEVDIVQQISTKSSEKREPSPELARISPLVTGPPKHKFVSEDCALPSNISNLSEKKVSDGTSELQISIKENEKVCEPVQQEQTPPNPWLAGGTLTASSVLLPQQLVQKAEIKKPLVSAETGPPECRPSSYVDAEGNIVWICPACGKVDDGSAMIGCDGCDAWYHWVCVGIFVAPKDNEDWYCRLCVTRKKGTPSTADKKRKRNKKK